MKKGITLVALVVTIIILLILATVTISLILGENSLFGRAEEGKIKTELTQLGERLQNAATAIIMDLTIDPGSIDVSTGPAIKTAMGDPTKKRLSSEDATKFNTFTHSSQGTVNTFTLIDSSTGTNHTLTFIVDFTANSIDYQVSK